MNHHQPYRPHASQIPADLIRADTRDTRRHVPSPLKGLPGTRATDVSYRASVPAGHGGRGVPLTYRALAPGGAGFCYRICTGTSESRSTAHYSLLTANSSYTFSAKEKDTETGLSYFGSRYYSSDLSVWLSVDPMSDKYPSLSPYTYCADNPVKLVDPNGETFVGVDGENVEVNQEKNGKISVGNNASDDLKRMASMINESGSKTAARQFMRLSKNECKIHFQIVQDDGNGGRLGYHQAHGENGNPLDWNDEQGTFSEMPSYINNTTYKEATITIFENVVAKSKGQFSYQDNKTLTLENAMVVVFAHEAEHNLNKLDILSIKYAIMGGGDNLRNVEKNAERIEKKTLREIYYAK